MTRNQAKDRPIEPLEILEKIKAAEAEAGRIVQEAKEREAVRIQQKALDESRALREKLLAEAGERAKQNQADRLRQAEKEARMIRRETEELAAELRSRAEPLIPDAVAGTRSKITQVLKDKSF
jgi:vacuolar-type H+-ATPase subunit H